MFGRETCRFSSTQLRLESGVLFPDDRWTNYTPSSWIAFDTNIVTDWQNGYRRRDTVKTVNSKALYKFHTFYFSDFSRNRNKITKTLRWTIVGLSIPLINIIISNIVGRWISAGKREFVTHLLVFMCVRPVTAKLFQNCLAISNYLIWIPYNPAKVKVKWLEFSGVPSW